MARERIRLASRLRFGRFQVVDDIEFWDRVEYPLIPEQPDDIQHVVKGFDRLDLLAQRYYQDPILQWVIAVNNGMEIWPTDLNVGSTLRIPAPRYVRDVLFQDARF